jgi:galactonate dehydratase
MKITRVQPLILGTAWRNLTVVVVDTDEGVSGVGEVRMMNHTDALLGYLKEAAAVHVLGTDPFDRERLVQNMWRRDYARAGEVAMAAIAVIEMACWDIIGKALGQPVYRLLGGAVRDHVKAYANGWYRVARNPDDFHAAAKTVIERGYTALKLDPFGAGESELTYAELGRATELVEAVRDAIGADAELFVEMHGRFTPAQALKIIHALAPSNVGWFEEPVPPDNIASLAKVARNTTEVLATGERIHTRHEFREVFEAAAADIIQPDISMFGGIGEAKKVAAWAEVYDVLIAPHNVGGPVATAAALHMAAATTNFKILEHFNDFDDDYVSASVHKPPAVVDGYFALPTEPGLGITLDESVFAEHPRIPLHFDLFQEDWHLRDSASRKSKVDA